MILLDTQVVVWLANEIQKISDRASEAIAQARDGDGIAISDKTLWELAMMHSKKRLRITGPLIDFLREVERTFVTLPVDAAVADRSVQFGKNFPGDPADKIIAATAIAYGLKLVTADAKIRKSGEVDCIW